MVYELFLYVFFKLKQCEVTFGAMENVDLYIETVRVRVMVSNDTFNNISVISWWSVLLLEETRALEKTTDLSQVRQTLSHIVSTLH